MKKIKLLLLLLLLTIIAISHAQDSTSHKKLPSLGGSILIKDFPTAAKMFSLNPTGWNNYLAPGANILFITGLSSHWDFATTLGASDAKYKNSNGDFYYHTSKSRHDGISKPLVDLNMLFNYKLLTDKHIVVPYLSGGFVLGLYNWSYLRPGVPLGGGLQFNLGRNRFLYLQTLLEVGIFPRGTLDWTKENLNYSLGVSFPLHKAKKVVNNIARPINYDTDGDGVPDSIDICPRVYGFVKYNGCPIPDTDGDSLNDEQDSCPYMPGLARYHGCPIPDTDRDGINDEQDSCPSIPGIDRYHGCPIPDSDGDGVNDEEDKCPHEAGTIENHGCPDVQTKINELARNIFFQSGSAIIGSKSYSILNQVVAIMVKYTNFNLDIQGHTDNIGSPLKNKKISQKRADAIKNYLISKGINAGRLNATGYGLERPIASNKTATGRALNRRVELHAIY